MDLYGSLLRPLLFRADAERAHAFAIRAAELASSSRWLCTRIERRHAIPSERLAVQAAGLHFRTPLGLAAGFDKSARAVPLLASLGFGHVEVGSISAQPSHGNPRPRLFRIPADEGIVVNYGLPNDGAERVAERVAELGACAPLGINIVSTNHGAEAPQPSDDAVIEDYLQSVRLLQPHADYLSLNLSCPNTREGRGFFHSQDRLARLLAGLDAMAPDKPVFLKVAPFPSLAELERFLATVEPFSAVRGFSVNLPPGKPPGLATPQDALAAMPGAVSGRPASAAADATLRELYKRMDRTRYWLVGSGGVFTADDAYRKIRLGATLVQLMTALVYRGTRVASEINAQLAQRLEAEGVKRVEELVGQDA